MTWNPNKPANDKSPALAPAEIRTNWARLQKMIEGDHLFNTTSNTDDGWHKVIRHIDQSGALGDGAPAPLVGNGQLYTKTLTTLGLGASTAGAGEQLMYQRGTGGGSLQEASLSVCPVRAAVNFDGRDSDGTCTINWSYNVSGVERADNKRYTITFEVDMPSVFYLINGSALQVSINTGTRAAAIVSRVKAVGTLQITCSSHGGNLDPDSIDTVIYGG